MTQKHTKTPWHLVTQSPDDEGLVRMAVRVPGPQPTDTEYGICTIDGHGSMEHDAREVADAELIVRAVNAHARMVEALESVQRSEVSRDVESYVKWCRESGPASHVETSERERICRAAYLAGWSQMRASVSRQVEAALRAAKGES